MMKEWMKRLALHYERARGLYPEDRLMILFDIDGTILDMRYMIYYVLKSFDRHNGTGFFEYLRVTDIRTHEADAERIIEKYVIPVEQKERVLEWYKANCWNATAILESHRPFAGVMEVIRWFQLQPNTYVGLNTGRPELIRVETLRSLNRIGSEYKVTFLDDLLYMNRNGWDSNILASKIEGVLHFQKSGYHIFAFVDNEPENLRAIADLDPEGRILLLHADTIFGSGCKKMPQGTVSGKIYDITELIEEKTLPKHVQFVWHGVNDSENLRRFLASNVKWAECDVRMNPDGNQVILRHDSFSESPAENDEDFLLLKDILPPFKEMGKSIKLDLKEDGILLDRVFSALEYYNIDETSLWFNGEIEALKEEGFRRIAALYSRSIIQCPINHLGPLILSKSAKALEVLDMLVEWGINRFSISWKAPHVKDIFDKLSGWGFEVNIYNVPDLESFLRTVLLLPASITSDFNFPRWRYYGRGSGENKRYHEYPTTDIPIVLPFP